MKIIKNYNEIWNRVKAFIEKEFDIERIYHSYLDVLE